MAKAKSRNVAVTIDGIRYVLLASLFDKSDPDQVRHYRMARRLARKGQLEGAQVIFGRACVPDTFDVSSIPAPTGRAVKRRDDGRQWYRIAATEDEYVLMMDALPTALPADAIVTPEQRRIKGQERRAARKAAKSAE